MRSLPLFLSLAICSSIHATAQQAGLQGINYQAVARNSKGGILSLQTIGVRFSILSGSATGAYMVTISNLQDNATITKKLIRVGD